tara:strand:+ start:2997 stop:3137 length:141 start_codon:yes stop_codon:yes gene_type:complete
MNKTISSPKPVQAGDYGKVIPQTPKNKSETKSINTDGHKTLSLWKS